MTERKTGATAEQVEAAARRYHEQTGPDCHWPCSGCLIASNEWAPLLVDEHHRIVSVADLRALLSAVPSEGNWVGEIVPDDLRDRITALIGDGA